MNQREKRTAVEEIVRELNDDLSTNTLSDAKRQSNLEQLKIYGRDPTGADALYSKSGITTLSKYAFGSYPSNVVHEALRVTANAILLQPRLQVALIGLGALEHVAKLYQNQDNDFEFLGARILFVCTYEPSSDFTAAFSADLLKSIEQHLARHASHSTGKDDARTPLELLAITETTKLIFNLNNKYPERCKPLNAAIPDLCLLLQSCGDPSPPLNPPTGPILNALACLDFGDVPARSAKDDDTNKQDGLLPRFIDILTQSIKQYKPTELDIPGLSLITVLRMLYDTSSPGMQARMRARLLPADSERDQPLGKSSSVASQLLRLTTSPGLVHLPEAISSFMFEMSDKDPSKFVKNIGYGYASGYLVTHKIPFPDSVRNATTIGPSHDQVPINPVTGQRLDSESVPDLPDMTQEEKELEAERLFVLFERLKATGVVNAENPVRQAMEEGRLKDISDDDSD